MKKAATFFAAALMVGLLALPVHAASFYPVSVEEYTYGPLDELRIDKVYQLSRSDDPKDIPTIFASRNRHIRHIIALKFVEFFL